MLQLAQACVRPADRECVGYEQAIARRQEIRSIAVDPMAGAATQRTAGSSSAIDAARFQQQLASATLTDTEAASSDASAALSDASADPYAALQGGGLSTQANLLAQLQGSTGAATGSTTTIPTQQLQQLLAQLQGEQQQFGTAAMNTTATSYANVSGKTAGVDPELLNRLDALGAQIGQPINIISGNRTREEQAALYEKYLNGTGNLAAPPGQSNHEHGAAADAYVNGVALANVPGARDAAQRLGLHFPVGGEAWHVERSDH